jgi:hypothetical protein
VESENEEEDKAKDGVDPDGSDSDSGPEIDDNEETLLGRQTELKAEDAELEKRRVTKLRIDVDRRSLKVAACEIEDLVEVPGSCLPAVLL